MIKLFEQYNEYSKVKDWLDEMNIINYHINDDLTVDVDGNVNLYQAYITNIPIQFGRVTGHFDCAHNQRFTSLKGCPKYVGGFFNCSSNELGSLEYAPEHVGIFLNCIDSDLTTLNGAPKYIGNTIMCQSNPLPKQILDLCINSSGMPTKEIKMLVKHQEEYGIWNNDGSLNEPRFKILLRDIENEVFE